MIHKNIYKSGFTLIEILVVLAIIGVLLLIGINGIQYGLAYSFDQNIKSQELELSQLLKDYYALNNQYPNQACDGSSSDALGTGYTYGGFDGLGGLPNTSNFSAIASSFPNDQTAYNSVLTSIKNEAWGANIGYCSSSDKNAYLLVLKTRTGQACTDKFGKSFYGTGSGIYKSSGPYEDYFQLATDPSTPLSLVQSSSTYGINCFKQ